MACHEVSQTDINLDEVSRKDPQDHRDITQFIQTEQSEIENVEQNTKLIWDYVDQHVLTSSDSEDETHNDAGLAADLASWMNQFSIHQNTGDSLLKILRKHGHQDLPLCCKTLLTADRHVSTLEKSGMEYVYLGLIQEFSNHVSKYTNEVREKDFCLEISLNIDGLPLFRSTPKSLWPILCAIHIEPLQVFPVALSFGSTKPTNLDVLHDTVTDLSQILHHGLECDGQLFPVKLRAIVCDAPAKSMVKAIQLYCGYYGCDRCSQKGTWIGRLTYQNVTNLELRSDMSFRSQDNEEHHKGVSPFCDLAIDMITVIAGL